MTRNEVLAIADFIGSCITESQAESLMDEIRLLSIADREFVMANLDGGKLYSLMSEHQGEMGGFERY